MTTALRTVELTPEAADFLRHGTPQPKTASTPPVIPAPVSGEEAQQSVEARSKFHRVKSTPTAPKKKPVPQSIPPAGLVSLTVRVPAWIPDNLLRASVDRKLKRQRPCTQQEIAAEAIVQWLERNGNEASGVKNN